MNDDIDITETLNLDFPDNLKEDINVPRSSDLSPDYRYLGLVRLANYLGHKFTEEITDVESVETAKFIVEGSPRRYSRVRLLYAIDVENPDTDDKEVIDREIKKWLGIENKVRQKLRDIEEKLDLDVMIWSHAKREENYEKD